MKHVVVVGAGIAGLTSALDLAAAGVAVTVVEAGEHVGGKMRKLAVGADDVDSGPTVLTMRWVFDELFAAQGADFGAYVPLRELDIIARHAFSDGSTLDLFASEERSEEAVRAFAGAAELERYRAFRKHAKEILAFAEGPFIRSEKPSLGAVVGHMLGGGLSALAKVDAHRSLYRALSSFFRDPRLLMLYGRYATYCGASPFECPATLSLISAVEADGVHVVVGGMQGLARGLERRARELGVTFCMGARVSRVETRRGRSEPVVVHLATGGEARTLLCDAVVLNADTGALANGAIPGAEAGLAVVPPALRSFSALTYSVVGTTSGLATVEHNVYFADDYAREMRELVTERRVPTRPSVYVCDQGPATAAGTRKYFVIVNAPATGDEPHRWTEEEIERCRRATFETMTRAGLELRAETMVTTTPIAFERRLPRTGGALYGARSTSPLSFFQRSGARTKTRGVYLAGGSVHPGPGVPMAAASGRFAARAVLEDLASTARSSRAGTSGSISTG